MSLIELEKMYYELEEKNRKCSEGRTFIGVGSLMECIISYAHLIKGCQTTDFDMVNEVNKLQVQTFTQKIKKEILNMFKLKSNDLVFFDSNLREVISVVFRAAEGGEYEILNDEEVNVLKRDILVKSVDIYEGILFEKERNPKYVYNGLGPFTQLREKYSMYNELTRYGCKREIFKDEDDMVQYGPQFGEIICKLIAGIDKYYIYGKKASDSLKK